MSTIPAPTRFAAEGEIDLAAAEGTLVVFADAEGRLGPAAAQMDRAMGGALARAVAASDFRARAGEP